MTRQTDITRRQALTLAAAGGAALAAGTTGRRAEARTATSARIVIIGAGAGGTALANRLVRRLEGAEITRSTRGANISTSPDCLWWRRD